MNRSSTNTRQSLLDIVRILAESYTKVVMYHDWGDYDKLEKSSASLLEGLKVPKERIGRASRITSLMYRTSDEADIELGLGNRMRHDELFRRIFKMAEELDGLLGINHGSVLDEMRWWYHYRLSRSKVKGRRPNKLSAFFHSILTLFLLYIEQLRRIKAPLKALACTYWLVKVGKKQEIDEWIQVEMALRRYWSLKIDANHGKVEPKLIIV